MAANDQGKAEDFKRATASALRAIAQTTDVQVAYQPGPSGLAGKRARLPAPSRALPAAGDGEAARHGRCAGVAPAPP